MGSNRALAGRGSRTQGRPGTSITDRLRASSGAGELQATGLEVYVDELGRFWSQIKIEMAEAAAKEATAAAKAAAPE